MEKEGRINIMWLLIVERFKMMPGVLVYVGSRGVGNFRSR